MSRYKTEDRQAQVGERILIVNAEFANNRYKNGDVLKVGKSNSVGVYVGEGVGIWHSEYLVISSS